MFVKTQYIDASTGGLPVQSGPALPHPELAVSFIDRREMPAKIYGEMPAEAEVEAPVVTELSQSEFEAARTEYVDHRRSILQNAIENADISETDRSAILADAEDATTLAGLRTVSADLQAKTDDDA